jgi:hypothetical protein
LTNILDPLAVLLIASLTSIVTLLGKTRMTARPRSREWYHHQLINLSESAIHS